MPGEDCVFCDRTKLEERIIHENESFYFVATLGQITNGGYVLLIPKRHVLCIGAMDISEIYEVITGATRLDDYILKEYHSSPVIFEHGIVGQTIKHAHLHFVPVDLHLTERIRKDFSGKEFDVVPSLDWIRRMYSERQEPYLFWNDASRESTICWNPPAPLYYLRKIIAEMLGRPERADWRAMDPQLDRQLWSSTVVRMKKYFPRGSYDV